MAKPFSFLLFLLAFAAQVNASDMGFRFNGTACVNAQNQTGMNPGYFGICGDLQHVTVSGVNFDGTDFTGAVFDGSNFQGDSFNNAKLDHASFKGTTLDGASMLGASLHNSGFQGASLINVKFAGTDIKSCDFSKANLSGVVLSTLALTDSKFNGVNFVSATLDNTDFSNSDLTSANFMQTNLQSAILDNTTMNSTNFSAADMTKASLKGVTATNVSFSGALLRQATLDGADITVGNFRAAQMDGSTMHQASFDASDFRSAVLKNAVITDAKFKGVRINKATVLPISQDDALKLGMYFDTTGNLLLIPETGNASIVNFVANLQKNGVAVTISPEAFYQFAGDLDLSEYTAIMIVNADQYMSDIPAPGQDALLAFVQNGGISLTLASATYAASDGFFAKISDLILFNNYQGNYNSISPLNIANPSNPFFYKITPNSFPADILGTVALTNFATNPSQVLLSDGNSPLMAVRNVGSGQAISTGFCPANITNCLLDLDFSQLIGNIVNAGQEARLKKH
jgi:uncharacterized protein YjbI with pentapeptide repeats